ncbi:MAG: transglutaminase family protein [Rhizobiaceae bacterium]|nr:transglutaminase family protein [Rhizobiaceae bacterium]
MQFKVGCDLAYEAHERSLFVFNVQASETESQTVVEDSLTITPELPIESYRMPETGNRCIRFEAGPGPVTLRYRALVDHRPQRAHASDIGETPSERLPPSVLPFLYPSRYCEADRLRHMAATEFGWMDRGHDRVQGICNWIYRHLGYIAGASDAHTSALDSLIDRAGVCRDFAHLGISMCRALGIPARYASVYAWRLRPADFHAVFEAYLDGRWYLFDPTRQAAIEGLVRIGVGRDAAEVAFADFIGVVDPGDMDVFIEAVEPPDVYVPTIDAISISER